LHVEAEPVEVGGLVRDVVERMQTAALAKDVALDTSLPDDDLYEAPLHVIGDAQRLTQVLLNLLTNALQHTPSGGKIVVGARRVGSEVQVTVQDTGEGIAPDALPHIFERFYRADQARSRGTGGSGLGLSIAKSLIEAQGGTITVESQIGQGSVFTVSLPRASS
jgi:two-component system sensor histidine kinase BaeS